MEVVTNHTGRKMEGKMKINYLVAKLILSSLLSGCTPPHQANEKTIIEKHTNIYLNGGSFNTISLEQGNKTLACIKYPGTINKGIFLDLSTIEEPIIKLQNITTSSDQIKLCNEYFNTEDYNNTAIFLETFEYTTNGYVFDSSNTKLITKNGNLTGLDFNNDNKADYLNTCSSIEAEHLNVWVDEKKNHRLAYAYRYIDADLLETCDNIDYPESH